MNKIINIYGLLALVLIFAASAVMTSCESDDFNTSQLRGGVYLNSFGPSPVARGGELRFLGSGMDQITKVSIPGCDDITDITVVSDKEIRVTVPQTAQPGNVVLTYAGGTITTKTMLTYTEPISIESLTPLTVKPGQELTINGEYLNLINEVYFSFIEGGDSVNVYKADFRTHERAKIVVVVPEEAVSGPIYISDAAELPNMIKSEEAITVVLPSVEHPVDLTDAKPGSAITIKGSDFDLIRKIEMPNGDDVEFTFDEKESSVTFTLPTNVNDGAIVAIPASGVKVAIANIGVVVPTELVATPASELRAGDIVTIKGVNIDQVRNLSFVNVDEPVEPATISATELTVAFPEMAQSGAVTLNLYSGKAVEVVLSTAKPEVFGFNPTEAPAAGNVTLQGKNLDLIAKITFGGGATIDVVDNTNAAELTVTVPPTADSGALTLTMPNGEKVTTADLVVTKPECAYIPGDLPTDLTAGDLMVVEVANIDKLSAVKVNGETCPHIINGSNLYFTLPTSCGKNTQVTLESSNGSITYTFDVTPATHVELVAYDGGPRDLGSWAGEDAGGTFRIYKEVFDGVPAGAQLVFHVAPYGDYSQIQVNDANWSQFEIINFNVGVETVNFELTADIINHILTTEDGWSNTGLIIQGCNTVISKVTIEYENSLETVIWEGPWTCSGWNGNQDLAWGGYDWTTVKAGQILRFYMTSTEPAGEWWCISLRHGDSWAGLVDAPSQYDTPENGLVEFVLTQNAVDDLIANGGLVITGTGYILNKITIE